MKLNKSGGDMFPNHYTTNAICGECQHKCVYCFVGDFTIPMLVEKYSGDLRLSPKVLTGKTGSGKTIFLCSCNDMFQEGVKEEDIVAIIDACNEYPDNTYLFQSKNPRRMLDFIDEHCPPNSIFSTTIETDNQDLIEAYSKAPPVDLRAHCMSNIKSLVSHYNEHYGMSFQTQVTIEPIMDFDQESLLRLLALANPDILYIGSDSGDNGLPEPSNEKIVDLIRAIRKELPNVDVRLKSNLSILKGEINGG